MSRAYVITFGERQAARKGHPDRYVVGIVRMAEGLTAKIGRIEDARQFGKRPDSVVRFLNIWKNRKYPDFSKNFRVKKIR